MITSPVLAAWIAAGFAAAVGLGWLLRGLWAWLCLATGDERARIRELVEQLHAAEEAREEAELALAEAELRAEQTEARRQHETAALRAEAAALLAEREAALTRAVVEAETEARTAWDGLAAARRRIGELERAAGTG